MIRKRFIFALLPLAMHVLLGAVVLTVDAVHGINDQDVSYAIALLFYYFNWLAVQGLERLGIELTIVRMILAGLVPWIGTGILIWGIGSLLGLCRCPKDTDTI